MQVKGPGKKFFLSKDGKIVYKLFRKIPDVGPSFTYEHDIFKFTVLNSYWHGAMTSRYFAYLVECKEVESSYTDGFNFPKVHVSKQHASIIVSTQKSPPKIIYQDKKMRFVKVGGTFLFTVKDYYTKGTAFTDETINRYKW